MSKQVKKKSKQKSRRPRAKSKSATSFKRKFNKTKQTFFQKIGVLTVFLVALMVLLGLIFFLWMNRYSESYQNQIAYEEQLQAREDFLEQLVPTAQRLQRQYGILTSVSLAQAALESDFGQSQLSADYNNLYGVKTEGDDPQSIMFETLEYVDDEWVTIEDYFKVYPSWEASMESHAELIYYGTSWNPDFYSAVLEEDTYYAQAQGLQSSGYATDPTYADKIVDMIETYDLNAYDQPTSN